MFFVVRHLGKPLENVIHIASGVAVFNQTVTHFAWLAALASLVVINVVVPKSNLSMNSLSQSNNKTVVAFMEGNQQKLWPSQIILFTCFAAAFLLHLVFKIRTCCHLIGSRGLGSSSAAAMEYKLVTLANDDNDDAQQLTDLEAADVSNSEAESSKKAILATSEPLVSNITVCGFILFYCFFADYYEHGYFTKQAKHFSYNSFFLPIVVCAFIGWLTARPVKAAGNTATDNGAEILSRQQTDEWKGWMQIVILMYHFTGAGSTLLPFYLFARFMVSSYFFMSGYGHFCYYYQQAEDNFKLDRIFNVLFRLNFLTILLCFVMHQPYMHYYFVPVITFWYLVILAFFAFPTKRFFYHDGTISTDRQRKLLIAAKFSVLFALIVILSHSEKLFELVFSLPVLRNVFELDGSLREWRFRWTLDKYSTFAGMLLAWVVCERRKATKALDVHDEQLDSSEIRPDNVQRTKKVCAKFLRSICDFTFELLSGFPLFVMGFVLFCAYFLVMVTNVCFSTKPLCSFWYAQTSFVPVLLFVTWRNATGFPGQRSKYSEYFTWIGGKFSLELYLLQCHMWLASNNRKMLVLLPVDVNLSSMWWWTNFVVAGVLFTFAAHEMSRVTVEFLKVLVLNKANVKLLIHVRNRASLDGRLVYALNGANDLELVVAERTRSPFEEAKKLMLGWYQKPRL